MRGTKPTPALMAWGLLLGLTAGPATAWAQSGIDMDDGTHLPAPAATAPAPTAAPPAPAAPAAQRDNIQDGVHYSLHSDDPSQDKLTPPPSIATPPPANVTTTTPSNQPEAPPATTTSLPEPVNLDHPKVVDTGRLSANDMIVSLYGIVGQQGDAVQQLQNYLATTDGHLTCPAQNSTDYVCLLADGTDIAAVALVNGAARARDDAPDAYKAQEADAQANRRGIWASLPSPPTVLEHPTVHDTATMMSGYQRYILDGLVGLGAPYASQLQGYIASNGDRLTCQAQATPGHYICVLDNGTDIAKVALVNGAARVGPDAPDSYRTEQQDALNNRRGYWLSAPASVAMAVPRPPPGGACCVYVAGDDGGDGITYVGGEPTAMIGGEAVFLVLAGAAGWGYYDHFHHWHDAPARFRTHMEHFHPNGTGLRAYRPVVVPGRPALATSGFRPGGAVVPGGTNVTVRTNTVVTGHPVIAPSRPVVPFATHSSVQTFAPRPGLGNGGFVRPAVTAGTFHPAGLGAVHSAAVVHPAVPANIKRR